MPFPDLVDADTGVLKPTEELAEIFKKANVDPKLPAINSCGSGVTACIVDVALRLCGSERTAVYDGSWSEYGTIDEPDFTK